MKAKIFLLFSIITLLILSQKTFATHIKAGDITAVRDATNPYKYTFTLTLYYNYDQLAKPYGAKETTGTNPGLAIDQGILDFGDNTSAVTGKPTSYVIYPSLNSRVTATTMCRFVLVHTFSGAANFTITYKDFARINGILNMSSSGDQYLYIDSKITVNPLIGRDALPVLTVPPIDQATQNKIYTYTPGAYDPDGDSLSFELIPPKTDGGRNVPGYQNPADAQGGETTTGGRPFLTIDPKTGQIIWNAPNVPGSYNIAIKVTEWRNGRDIGYVVRDMQIIVGDFQNNPPVLELPPGVCNRQLIAEVGTTLKDSIRVTDPDPNERIRLEWYGQPFLSTDITTPNMQVTVQGGNPYTSPMKAYIQWTTGCNQVRNQPYQAVFKAIDQLSTIANQLTDVRSLNIKVLGPKPVLTTLTAETSNSIRLNWANYGTLCSQSGIMIYIYRATCDSSYTFEPCKDGLALPSNYELIAQVPASTNTYLDNNKNKGLKGGISYYYMLMAVFPSPGKGQSQLSLARKVTLGSDNPLITTISVTNTSAAGSIDLVWRKPSTTASLPPTAVPPYTYKVFRKEAGSSAAFTQIAAPTDTLYTDSGLNTADKAYTYYIELTDANNKIFNSEPATTLYLKTQALDGAAKLSWTPNALPWNTSHFNIYSYPGNKRVARANGSDSTFTVQNLINCRTDSFYVEAVGKYCFDENKDSIMSKSQIQEVTPFSTKTTPPPITVTGGCPGLDCSQPAPLPPYDNVVSWKYGNSCASFREFNLYFSDNDTDETQLLATTHDTSYIHQQTDGYAGCYQVQVVINFEGKKYASEKSEKVCVDNCYCFELPNVFTPNGDGKNELFQPINPARFVDEVDFKVYNRWGKLVFKKSDDVNINWDGKDMADGVYYYQADVKFNILNKGQRNQTFKGWVQIIR